MKEDEGREQKKLMMMMMRRRRVMMMMMMMTMMSMHTETMIMYINKVSARCLRDETRRGLDYTRQQSVEGAIHR